MTNLRSRGFVIRALFEKQTLYATCPGNTPITNRRQRERQAVHLAGFQRNEFDFYRFDKT
jgi:hypothetical protein